MTLRVEPSVDYPEIQSVIERLWGETRLDADRESPPPGWAEYLLGSPGSCALRASVDGVLAGYFLLIQQQMFTHEAHTLILSQFRGKPAIEATLSALRFMFTEMPCHTVRSYAYSTQPHVRRFCRLVGLREVGVEPGVGTLRGAPVDLHRYAITGAQWRERHGHAP